MGLVGEQIVAFTCLECSTKSLCTIEKGNTKDETEVEDQI
jgi:hypothetical protein